MKVAVFDIHAFERPVFAELSAEPSSAADPQLRFFEVRLSADTVQLAYGFDAVCVFTHDQVDADVLAALKAGGVRLVALRCAGFNHVDVRAAERLGIAVVRVPAYSPYAVAEHAMALILALDRKICRANARVRELNFSLDGLVGFDLHGKTVGIIGFGKIGSVMAKILNGFGCNVLVNDPGLHERPPMAGISPVSLDELLHRSDIISLHLPLTTASRHLIDAQSISKMKRGVMLINTGRGALVDAKALIGALKSGQVGAAGLDVYEEEEDIFFSDLSTKVLQDDVLARLLTFPNVLITSHQAFLTQEALHNIVGTTLQNISDFSRGLPLKNQVQANGDTLAAH